VDINEYQDRAQQTDQVPGAGADATVIPLLGMAGEVGSLLVEYKKRLRDGPAHVQFEEQMAEELGDILWYAANLATKFGLKLSDIAERNLAKTADRWGKQDGTGSPSEYRLFDEGFPTDEQLPRRFVAEIQEIDEGGGKVRVRLLVDGTQVGDKLTDNAYEDDGYRFHDVLHLTNMTLLGWSPTLRGKMHRKRRSAPKIDEVEDGGRAIVIDEAIVAFVFDYARRHNFLDGVERLDYALLRTIKALTSGLEVAARTAHEWEQAILRGYALWRQVRTDHGGALEVDLEQRGLQLG
jgi:NTP pyrophosphatase (non-canonical NTP hydrolase)